ncbi:hypothetical protein LAZ67_11002980, partial [Cordylochernes scorpioides]
MLHMTGGTSTGSVLPREQQSLISRLKSGHLRTMTFQNGCKVFPLCTKCNSQPATPRHIIDCIDSSIDELYSSPADTIKNLKLYRLDTLLLGLEPIRKAIRLLRLFWAGKLHNLEGDRLATVFLHIGRKAIEKVVVSCPLHGKEGAIAPLVSHISEFPIHGYRSGSRHRTTGQSLTCAASPARHVEEYFWAGTREIRVEKTRALRQSVVSSEFIESSIDSVFTIDRVSLLGRGLHLNGISSGEHQTSTAEDAA